jgi:hypothetical protein
MSDFVPWLKKLAADGGKGVVNNVDARSLGRLAYEIEGLRVMIEYDEFEIRRLKALIGEIEDKK